MFRRDTLITNHELEGLDKIFLEIKEDNLQM